MRKIQVLGIAALLWILQCYYITHTAHAMAQAHSPGEDRTRVQEMIEIFQRRNTLWNDLLTNGEMDLQIMAQELEKILTGSQLEMDIAQLQAYIESPTSFEMVKEMKWVDQRIVENNGNLELWYALIQWELEGEPEPLLVAYGIQIQRVEGRWLLENYWPWQEN